MSSKADTSDDSQGSTQYNADDGSYVPSENEGNNADTATRRTSARQRHDAGQPLREQIVTAYESEGESDEEIYSDVGDLQDGEDDEVSEEENGEENAGLFRGESAETPSVQGLHDTASQQPSQVLFEDYQDIDYLHEYLASFIRLVQQLWEDEVEQNERPAHQYQSFLRQGVNILCSMLPEVAVSIIDGTIPLRACDGSRPIAFQWLEDTKQEWMSMSTAKNVQYQPTIYGQYLVNDRGEGPSEQELELIINKLRKYTHFSSKNADFARRIDQVLNYNSEQEVNWKRGERRYLPKTKYRAQHVQTVKKFCDNVSNRLSKPPSPDFRPRALAEFGYTNHTRKRLNQHARHSSSNRLMNLTESICAKYLPDYSIKQFVLYKIFTHDQGAIAEIIINRIGKGFIESGYGFSHHMAGVNNASAGIVPAISYVEYTNDAYLYTPFKAEHKRQLQLFKELSDEKHRKMREELERLEKEIEEVEAKTAEYESEAQRKEDGTDERAAEVFAKIEELAAVVDETAELFDKLYLEPNDSAEEGDDAGDEMDIDEYIEGYDQRVGEGAAGADAMDVEGAEMETVDEEMVDDGEEEEVDWRALFGYGLMRV